jgi:hypothetical protein
VDGKAILGIVVHPVVGIFRVGNAVVTVGGHNAIDFIRLESDFLVSSSDSQILYLGYILLRLSFYSSDCPYYDHWCIHCNGRIRQLNAAFKAWIVDATMSDGHGGVERYLQPGNGLQGTPNTGTKIQLEAF